MTGNSYGDQPVFAAPVILLPAPAVGNGGGALSCIAGFSLAFLLLGLPALAAVDGSGSLAGYRAPLAAALALAFQAALWVSGRPKLPGRIALALLLLGLQMIIFAAEALARPQTTDYATWKLMGFGIFGLLPTALIALNYTSEPHRIKHLLIGLFAMAVAPAVMLLPGNPALLDPMRAAQQLYLIGANPIPVSRSLGTAALLAIACSMTRGGWRRLFCMATAVVLVLGQFVVGERGPILALLISLVFIPRSLKRRVQVMALIVGAVLVAVIAGLQHPNHKFTMEAVEEDGRIDIMSWALQAFTEHPLIGAGLGSFYLPNGDHEYFHNLEGELATETGLIGLAAFAGFLIVLWQCGNRSRTPQATFTLALAVYWLAAAQVSGDIVSNSMCWVSSMLWACSQFQAPGTAMFAGCGLELSATRSEAVLR